MVLTKPHTQTHRDIQFNFGFLGSGWLRTNINLLPICNVSCVIVLWGLYPGLSLETSSGTDSGIKDPRSAQL